MSIRNDFADAVGTTPLIRLRAASEATGCTILGKCEFMNPGGSVKDRAAKYMILDAEARKEIEPGGIVIEGTAGNTGIGLAHVGRSRGYRTVITMPNTQSQEKVDALRLAGAEIHAVPAVPFSNPENYVHQAERLADQLATASAHGVLYANQWENPSNGDAHVRSTGPEIWDQTNGTVDGFICAVGTGGTISGVSRYLKHKRSEIVIGVADPGGSCMSQHFAHGRLERNPGGSITEGIGQGRITANVAAARVDQAWHIPDTEMLEITFGLLREEGLLLGGSSGINVAGAIRLARELGPGKTIVTILCDGGQRYQSKLFNRAFLQQQDLPVPDWL